MGWFRFWLVHFLIVFVKSELQSENNEGPKSTASSAFCSTECNQQLQNRLETIEAAVRTIVSAVSSQTDDLFAPIKEIFQLDPSVRSILSLNYTTSSTIASSKNSTFKTKSVTIAQGNSQGNQQPEKSTAVDNLKGAVKCSLAHLVDINTIDFNSRLNKSSEISASLTNDSLELTWSIFSTECLKFSSGVWIRVYQQAPESDYKLQPETSLYVPQKCLKKKSKTSYSIVLSPSPLKGKKISCAFYLTRHLTPCLAYVVEIIPNFQSLRGKTLRTDIIVPPNMKRSDESHFKPLISVAAQSTSLTLNWEDNSGCAEQLTSFTLKIFQDGIVDEVERPNMTVTIPRSCLKRSTNEDNLFSLVLPAKPANQLMCPAIEWKPLDRCRKYRIDMNSQYSDTWNGPSSSLDIFTGQEEVVIEPTTDLSNAVWRCPKQHYFCNDYDHDGCAHTSYYICDGQYNCEGMDEKYCDQTLCVKDDGFKCGRQCVPKELVCDGKYDCLDGSDEDGCSVKCEHLTNPSGHFSSDIFPKPTVDVMHPERILAAVRKTIVLISVQRSHQIWLSFDRFTTVNNTDFLKVYDGPFSTSPLLLSHSGSKKPPSIRSSANELFLEIPSYYDTNYVVEGSYTSVNSTDEPFKPGCGGFMNAEGTFFTPNYSSDTADIVDCFWLIETRQIDDLILLQRNYSDLKHPMAALFSSRTHPEMIVYDGWSTDGLVLYDTKYSNIPYKKVIYSVSNKMMIHFKPPRIQENHVSHWNVSKISTPQCKNYLEGTSGTIKSPNYPKVYPNLTDCRWTISVTPGSKVRLLFAFFETQEGADFISVYDGSTINEKLLLTESGSVPTPFVVNSSTNQVLVRFTSDGDTSLSGFLAVYSSV